LITLAHNQGILQLVNRRSADSCGYSTSIK